jgi:DNA-binding NtrC family response regulator
LVDDEDSVRNVGELILRRFGYTVLTAKNGYEGIEVFDREKERVNLVILDLIMPEMGGNECLKEIMKIAPDTKVIIASGYSTDGHFSKVLEEGAKASVRKPYEAHQLLEIVRTVLDEE